jgi:DMSO reductase anchor subunit
MAAPHADERLDPVLFLVLAAVAMGASTFHLGRKLRAWRAILNWRGSWLSREIILFTTFVALSLVHLVFGAVTPAFGALTAVVGLAALFAVDNVYEVTRTPGLQIHSARTVSTAVLVGAMVSGSTGIVAAVLVGKAALYLNRHLATERARAPGWVALIRVVVGNVMPLWALYAGYGGVPLAGCVAIGEIIDRAEFYAELDVPTPRRQIVRDLELSLPR